MLERVPLRQSQAAPCSQLLCARQASEDAGDSHAKESGRTKTWSLLGRFEQGVCELRGGDNEDGEKTTISVVLEAMEVSLSRRFGGG